MKLRFLPLLLLAACSGCQEKTPDTPQDPPVKLVKAPDFNADSAYAFVAKQLDFGYRIPESKAHAACAQYLVDKLKSYTPDVEVQTGTMKMYNGKEITIKNIIAHFGKGKPNRMLLSAHWDSREWADQDPDKNNWHKPVPGANDGGSGVGVLLEIARQLSIKNIDMGVTILLNDAEDQGTPEFDEERFGRSNESWCLGTQYFAKALDKSKPMYAQGINVDMVGGKQPRFLMEEESTKANSTLLEKTWRIAMELGYSNYFVYNRTSGIIDDHVFLGRVAQIPTIDIIDKDDARPKGFNPTWHTLQDNMDNIDKGTLKAVGQTVLTVLYNMDVTP
jgi:Zn-dependent M28 family amino/carboxypeptidase